MSIVAIVLLYSENKHSICTLSITSRPLFPLHSSRMVPSSEEGITSTHPVISQVKEVSVLVMDIILDQLVVIHVPVLWTEEHRKYVN